MTRRGPRLPPVLRIGSKRYTVERSDRLCDDATETVGYPLNGLSDPWSAQIILRENNAPETDAETLLHEVLHQCLRASGVWPDDLRPGRGGLTVEEQIVGGITGPLLGALRDHPELVRFLVHENH